MSEGLHYVDFHNHVIPGVDDGAVNPEESAHALRSLIEHGVTHVIATPHVDGSVTRRPEALQERLGAIDTGWAILQQLVNEQFPDLVVLRGAEVMLDAPDPILDDERLRLGGGRFVLVEYPFMMVPPHSPGVLRGVVAAGLTPVVAHPERYAGINPESELPARWRAAGALLQVNAGSITGRYGPQVRDNAFALLERGLADFICSDYHSRGRPSLNGARALLTELNAAEQSDLLLGINPRRLLEGQLPIPVPPLPRRRGMLRKLKQWFR
jgi:protein-tyrosine phosphatase